MNDNWSRGSAYSIILLVVSVTFVLLMMRLFKVTIMRHYEAQSRYSSFFRFAYTHFLFVSLGPW